MDQELKQSFPVDWVEDNYVSRREFFKFLTLASGGLAAGSVGMAVFSSINRGRISFEPAMIANVSDVPVGGSLQFSYPRPQDLCVLIQPKAGEYVAYSRRCTHLSCPVEYQPEHERLYCPCHNGAFSLTDGQVLQGPPPRPLPKVLLEVRGAEIYALGVSHQEVKEG
ncbi:MAG: Rieske (2Fe-2S) protein [Armatimonadetes bacterium]|nr:Rieske (2Fe-2S) protein [Armatimonadota bacterium]